MLADLNLPILYKIEETEQNYKRYTVYKIVHHLVAIPDNCLTPVPSSLRIESGYFNQLNTNVDSFKLITS